MSPAASSARSRRTPTSRPPSSALGAIGAAVAECPPQELRGNGFAIEPQTLTSTGGEESLAYVDRYLDADGYTGEGNVFVLTRVGNALLLDKTYVGRRAATWPWPRTSPTCSPTTPPASSTAMCVFSADGCTG